MKPVITLSLLFTLFATSAQAEEKPRTLSGASEIGNQQLAAEIGADGGWLVQSQNRWDAQLKQLEKLKVKLDNQLGQIDFTKESIACVFHYGDRADHFFLRNQAGDNTTRTLEIGLVWVAYKDSWPATMGVWKIFAVPVPKSAATKLNITSFSSMTHQPIADKEEGDPEWEWTFADNSGESIGGLTANIEPQAGTIKPGEDIQLKFTLNLADAAKSPNGKFASKREAVSVWDGKYSNGYRNHAFLVQLPDGTVKELRPKVIDQWDKNIPHPVEIKADKPYVLPGWVEGDKIKSLKKLGLDTTAPGVYLITGIYEERGQPTSDGKPPMWGGIVRSNTVKVEVK